MKRPQTYFEDLSRGKAVPMKYEIRTEDVTCMLSSLLRQQPYKSQCHSLTNDMQPILLKGYPGQCQWFLIATMHAKGGNRNIAHSKCYLQQPRYQGYMTYGSLKQKQCIKALPFAILCIKLERFQFQSCIKKPNLLHISNGLETV